MSAFDRLPASYIKACERFGVAMGPITGFPPRRKKLSPQNRRVRFEVDLSLARAKTFEHRDSRQQRRSRR